MSHRNVAAFSTRDALLRLANWIYLLGFNGDFKDEAGNAEFVKLGAGTSAFVDTVSDYFPAAEAGWDVANNLARASGVGLGTSNGEWCVALIYQPDTNNPTQRIWEAIDSVSSFDVRRIFWIQAGIIGAFDGATRNTARVMSSGNEAMFFMRANGAEGTVDFFENGIKFATLAFTNGAIPGTANRLYGVGDYNLVSPTNPAFGIHRMSGLIDGAVSDETIYEIFKQRSGGRSHDWLGRPALQENCIFHLPLWEKAGTQFIDVSGNQNHSIATAAPTAYNRDSVTLNGSQSLPAPIINFLTTSFTMAVKFSVNASLDGIFGVFSSPSNYISVYTSGANILVRVYNNNAPDLKTITIPQDLDGSINSLCIRWNHSTNEIAAWYNGVAYTPLIFTGAGLAAPNACNFGGTNANFIGGLAGIIKEPRLYNVALSDALCLELST